jgi:hypothetical protein
MATPHVSGAVALLLQSGYRTPAVIDSTLKTAAATGKITGLVSGTANLLLQTNAVVAPVPASISPSTQSVSATVNVRMVASSVLVGSNFASAPRYSISGSLPRGLSFSSTTGVIAGTPTVLLAPTVFTVTGVSGSSSATATISLTVAAAGPVPSVASVLVATAVSGRGASLVWVQGAGNGSPITAQTISIYLANGRLAGTQNVAGNVNSAVITRLMTGSSYYFKVAATNSNGTSALSGASNTIIAIR